MVIEGPCPHFRASSGEVDDDEWEERERQAGRGVSIPKFPMFEANQKGKKTEQEVESMIQLAKEVQYSILTRKLKPGKLIYVSASERSEGCLTD